MSDAREESRGGGPKTMHRSWSLQQGDLYWRTSGATAVEMLCLNTLSFESTEQAQAGFEGARGCRQQDTQSGRMLAAFREAGRGGKSCAGRSVQSLIWMNTCKAPENMARTEAKQEGQPQLITSWTGMYEVARGSCKEREACCAASSLTLNPGSHRRRTSEIKADFASDLICVGSDSVASAWYEEVGARSIVKEAQRTTKRVAADKS